MAQPGWNKCNKCEGMFYAARGFGHCPAGGHHDDTDSPNYSLEVNLASPIDPAVVEASWRHCLNCEGLWLEGVATSPAISAICPNPTVENHVSTDSGNYVLTYGTSTTPGEWLWCHYCKGLYSGADATLGVCPRPDGGPHGREGSKNYVIQVTAVSRAA